MTSHRPATVTLHWIPLGAGGAVVPRCGRFYEAVRARREHRPSQRLVHAALSIDDGDRRYVVEQAPAWDTRAPERGVTVTGPVGAAWLGRCRYFRYEIRCWPGGTIPDLDFALVSSPIPSDPDRIRRLLDLTRSVPAHTWGRDEIGAHDMWNSNSVIAWLLTRSGHDTTLIAPPDGCRAPGWTAGSWAATSPDEGPQPGWRAPQP
ncbi:hypothetical protein AAFP30_18500 [Gordonia sp. CPCC 205515]|uniref:hypothetical protein n=1 Tax=Gordonia sp. CPCC 205515 TaxID=3140791 RepID=UPI003AF3ACE7